MEETEPVTEHRLSSSAVIGKLRAPNSCRRRCSALLPDDEDTLEPSRRVEGDAENKERGQGPDSGDRWEITSAGSTLAHDPPEHGLTTDSSLAEETEGSNPVDFVATETGPAIRASEDIKSEETARVPYSAFTKNQRWMIVVISSVAGIFRWVQSSRS